MLSVHSLWGGVVEEQEAYRIPPTKTVGGSQYSWTFSTALAVTMVKRDALCPLTLGRRGGTAESLTAHPDSKGAASTVGRSAQHWLLLLI